MQPLRDELKETLQQDERLVIDGNLAKNKIVELALKLDKGLLKLLLGNDRLKEHFFKDVDSTYVFDKQTFQKFISNKEFLPDSYTAFKNKIGLTVNGDDYLIKNNDVSLIWPYKDCVLEGGQTKEDAKRTEIFWNETLAPDQIDRLLDPKALTNFKKFDKDGAQDVNDFSIEDNYVIKGNNLLALHSLRKVFAGKVKLIYIDPPYNTGNDDFGYNDRFNHSAWLTFMKNRLNVAQNILTKDGTIWINLDDSEVFHCKILCDEIFGRENFIGTVIWEKSDSPRMDATYFSVRHDYILVYGKNKEQVSLNKKIKDKIPDHYNKVDEDGRIYYLKPLRVMGGNVSESLFFPMEAPDGTEVLPYESDGTKGCWRWSEEKIQNENNRIEWVDGNKGWNPYFRIYADQRTGRPPETIWSHQNVGSNRTSKNEMRSLFGGNKFDTPKPEKLLKRIIHIGSNEGDLVLDFFAGSGTTGAVAHKMGRRYILCEQMDYVEDVTLKRLQKVIEGEQGGISEEVEWQGGGSFVYAELMEYNAKFVKEIEAADSKEDLQQIWVRMQEHAFLSYKVNPADIDSEKASFDELTLNQQKQLLIELLDKNQLYVNYSEIEDEDYGISEDGQKQNHQFYKLK